MRWFVPALCGVAALLAVALGAAGGDTDPGTAPGPSVVSTPTGPAAPEDPGATALSDLRGAATEAAPLPAGDERDILEACLAVPEDADASLSPDPDEVAPVVSGHTEGAAVVVWVGPTPQYERAVGTCVALDRGDGWTVAGRSVRRDLGPGSASLVWQPVASEQGIAASLIGRVRDRTADVIVVIDDGRVLRQEPVRGFVAIPWQPVREPVRLVTAGAGDEVRYDGPLIGYAPDG